MKNSNLYVSPWGNPQAKHSLDVAFDGMSKYENEIFTHETTKAKRSEVPPLYRKSILKSVFKGILFAFFVLSVLNCILFFATVL